MQYLFKTIFFIYIASKMVMNNVVDYKQLCVLMIIIAFDLVRQKYVDSIYMTYAQAGIILFGISLCPSFAMLLGISCYDLVAKKSYIGILILIATAVKLLKLPDFIDVMLVIGICSLLSYISSGYEHKSEMLKLSYDKQRSYNYELETAKMKLLRAAEDSARIAEINERNRIAREIHDNIGHNIAGVLMVMQAALKLIGKDDEKSKELLQRSVDTLSDGLTLLKNTVYNIKPKEELGIDYIEKVIENFSFCKVKFERIGDLTNLSPARLELVATNIKEALTNVSKYSKATLVELTLSCNENFLRLQIKDNGVGCEKIKESLGLSGMRERVKNAGGSITINGDDGFMIVCVIPLNEKVGEIFEGFNSGR